MTDAAAPKRIQLSRRRGWRMPPGAVKVDRSTPWGNPWRVETAREVGYSGTADELRGMVVRLFARAMSDGLPATAYHREHIAELRGKDLACWCPLDGSCHADILLAYANGPACQAVSPSPSALDGAIMDGDGAASAQSVSTEKRKSP